MVSKRGAKAFFAEVFGIQMALGLVSKLVRRSRSSLTQLSSQNWRVSLGTDRFTAYRHLPAAAVLIFRGTRSQPMRSVTSETPILQGGCAAQTSLGLGPKQGLALLGRGRRTLVCG